MLCYRCGSHSPDDTEVCPTCGQRLVAGRSMPGATSMRKRPGVGDLEGAPYRQGDMVAGRYLVKDTAGAGPLAYVYRCQDKELDVEVALKLIQPRFVQHDDERKALSKVLKQARKFTQPNLARVYDESKDDQGWPFYTLPYLDGLTLRKIIDQRLAKGQFFTVREVEPIFTQLVSALEAVHTHGPHANLKPSNIIIQPDLLKLTDYGLPLAIPRQPFVQAQGQRGFVGARYLPPEYMMGEDVDVRMDQYSLGVVLGEMLAGVTPDGGELPELRRTNPELDIAVESLYRRAINASPNSRFRSLRELLGDLNVLGKEGGGGVISPPRVTMPLTPASNPPVPGPVSAVGPARDTVDDLEAARHLPPPVEDLPADATIPISAEELAARLADLPNSPVQGHGEAGGVLTRSSRLGTPPPKPISTPPLRNSGVVPPGPQTLPVAAASKGSRLPPPVPSRPPVPPPSAMRAEYPPADAHLTAPELAQPVGAESPTMAFETVLGEPSETSIPALFAASRQGSSGGLSRSAVWLTVLSVSGVLIGALVGLWWLGHVQKTVEPAPAPTHAERAPSPPSRLDLDAPSSTSPVVTAKDKPGKASAGGTPPHASAPPPAVSLPVSGPRKETMAAVARSVGASGGTSCPEDMRFVPAGPFRMGTAKDDPMRGFDERVLASVEVSGFCIDAFEYPNQRGQSPAVNVSWNEAKRKCEATGKRLCTEQEWEKACKGPASERFPYGNDFDATACNTDDGSGADHALKASGRYAKCHSGFGVSDLSGNVAEWISTSYATGADKTQKGGSYSRPDYAARCSSRKNGAPGATSPEVGFRCCAGPGR